MYWEEQQNRFEKNAIAMVTTLLLQAVEVVYFAKDMERNNLHVV